MTDDEQGVERIKARFAWIETVALDKRTAGIPMRVAVILSALIGEKGYAWPGRDTLAAIAGSDKSNIKDALKKLVDLGYLRIEANVKQGRGCVDHYWPTGHPDASPVWSRYRIVTGQRGSTHPPSDEPEQEPEWGVPRPARGVSGPDKGGVETPRLLEGTPDSRTPYSEPNGSADAVAPASRSRVWKGSEGSPLPSDFPDDEAMATAHSWMSFDGVNLNLGAEREAFRRYHYSVHCLQRDWMQSWEIWIEHAIDGQEAIA